MFYLRQVKPLRMEVQSTFNGWMYMPTGGPGLEANFVHAPASACLDLQQ